MVVTIVMPVSRPDFLKRVFAQLEMLECDAEHTNLLVYVDGDLNLYEKAANFVRESKFKEKICSFRRKGVANVSHIRTRRDRIADIHNELKKVVGTCDYVFLTEDDTLLPTNALTKLLSIYSRYPYAGLISGVQIGRWGFTVAGIWQVDNVYDIRRINSMLAWEHGVQEIDAAGMYCCLIKRSNYILEDFESFEDILGPDFNLGVHLRMNGYKNYVDWSIQTTHLTKKGEIKLSNTELQQIIFKRIDEKHWEQEVL